MQAPVSDLDLFLATMVGQSEAVAPELARRLVRERYGLHVTAARLTGERDENFKLRATDGSEYVLKIANPAEDPAVTELPGAVLLHLERADPGLPCPRVRPALDGSVQIRFEDAAGLKRTARLITYLPGKPLQSASRSSAQRAACGRLAARLGHALRGFEHPAAHRALIWDLRNVPRLQRLLNELPQLPESEYIGAFIAHFRADIEPALASLRQQFVHNDLNSRNILVDPRNESVIVGIIDFGDSVHTALGADLAIAALAHITGSGSFSDEVSDFVHAYHQIEALLPDELQLLNSLIAARIVASVLIQSWHAAKNPHARHFEPLDEGSVRMRLQLARRIMRTPWPFTS